MDLIWPDIVCQRLRAVDKQLNRHCGRPTHSKWGYLRKKLALKVLTTIVILEGAPVRGAPEESDKVVLSPLQAAEDPF